VPAIGGLFAHMPARGFDFPELITLQPTHFSLMQYEDQVRQEVVAWQKKVSSRPTVLDRMSKRMQTKMNSYIPDKVHKTITTVIKQMIRGVLFGAGFTVPKAVSYSAFKDLEAAVQNKISDYKRTASIEGGITGAGGILLGLADFPILLGIKIKLLYDIATMYGHDINDYKERLYILHIFQLAFSSQEHRRQVYNAMVNWKEKASKLPEDINKFDWRNFQQEYRDYIDLAKLAQLIPGIGAVVGLIVNYKLIQKLGLTAMNAYRMRRMEEKLI
jgi:proteasome assembly chaperone (PAC2) family protein